MNLGVSSFILIAVNLGLLWLLMAAPVGLRTLRLKRRYGADPARLWSAVYPLGENAAWHPSVISSQSEAGEGHRVRQSYSHLDRRGLPIERVLEISGGKAYDYSARVVDDSALDHAFWSDFHEERHLDIVDGGAELTVEQTDRYRGFAFLIFRYFALRRELETLEGWLKTGQAKKVGIFENPAVQLAMAVLSTLLLWPFFGLNMRGLMLSSILTVVIVLHELGHMIAYLAFGHRSARIIFVPLLGGIAIGGRPYNSLFEVAVCALMGAGVSAFLVPVVIVTYLTALFGGVATPLMQEVMLFFLLILGAFNLLNLLPMHRFDGGQVLRQVFPDKRLLALASFGIAAVILATGWEIGLSNSALMAGLAVFILMSLIGAGNVKPRDDLVPMSAPERLLAGLGLYAVVVLHSYAIIFSCWILFS